MQFDCNCNVFILEKLKIIVLFLEDITYAKIGMRNTFKQYNIYNYINDIVVIFHLLLLELKNCNSIARIKSLFIQTKRIIAYYLIPIYLY